MIYTTMSAIKYEGKKPGIFEFLHTLSIDVVLGSIFCALMVVHILSSNPGPAFWFVLPTTVWILYTLDHLVDGLKLKYHAHTYRHWFHYHNRRILFFIIAILVLANLAITLQWMDLKVLIFGIILGSVAILYLFFVFVIGGRKTVLLQKEFMVASIYTCGIWGAPLVLLDFTVSGEVLFLIVSFFLLALADIMLFSIYEMTSDKNDQHVTLAVRFGSLNTTGVVYSLLIIIVAVNIYLVFTGGVTRIRILSIIYILMAVILFFVINFQSVFRKNFIYRYLGEMVFWLPGLVVIFS
ncbi:MAG: hypothetical protein JW731_17935 [Bacteroidales bacterium]|nr:hypothetical protein [Bacteroidales bacterium]